MAREDVNIKVSANVAEAIRMWQAMEHGPKAMGQELDALGRRGRASGDAMASGFDRAISKWSAIAVKIQGAKFLLDGWMQANKEAMQMQDSASVKIDTLMRQFQVQSGLGDEAMKGVMDEIAAISKRRGTSLESAADMARQMVSSDFSLEEIFQGGALDAGLTTANAMGAAGKNFNATEFTSAISQYFNATGQDKTAENVLKMGQQMFLLYGKTDFQAVDLKELAPEAMKIRSQTHMSESEMLAVFSQFRDVTSAAMAATAMRAGYVNLRGAGGDPTKTGILEEMGLKPEDVDFEGENFLQVQERIAKALEGSDDEDRGIYAKKLFGDEGLLWESVLGNAKGVAQTRERLGWGADRGAFTRAARVTEGSLEAEGHRADTDIVEAFANAGVIDSETARKRLISNLKKRGATVATRAIAAEGFDKAIALGADVEEATWLATPGYAPWRALRSSGDSERFQRHVTQRSSVPAEGGISGALLAPIREALRDLNVTVRFVDQNNLHVPHRAEVHDVGKNAAGRSK